jgi:hypothetical protein
MILQGGANSRSRGTLLIQVRGPYRFHRVCRRKSCRDAVARRVTSLGPGHLSAAEVQRRLFVQPRTPPSRACHYPHLAEIQDGAVARAGSGPIGGEPAWGRSRPRRRRSRVAAKEGWNAWLVASASVPPCARVIGLAIPSTPLLPKPGSYLRDIGCRRLGSSMLHFRPA